MNYDTLYKATRTNKVISWTIRTDGAEIITRWGTVGGKMQETSDTVREGKNIGKKNETTPETQAEAQALSTWTRKLKSDYVRTYEAAEAGEDASDLVKGGIKPMLAFPAAGYWHKTTWPGWGQPKLDGHRGCAIVDENNKCRLWSRKRHEIFCLPHIVEAIEALGIPNRTWDAEFYNMAYAGKFEELSSYISRGKTPKPGYKKIHFCVYDYVSDDDFEVRNAYLDKVFANCKLPLVRVRGRKLNNREEAEAYMDECVAAKFEGAILRQLKGKYTHNKTWLLLKLKPFDDDEFTIVGVKEGKGKLQGHGIFICKTKDDNRFECKMAGPIPKLKVYWDQPDDYIGLPLTVQYNGFTTKNSVPKNPVGLRLRYDL